MVRIGVYRGHEKDSKSGLSLMNFDVLNELEETENKLKDFQLVSRFSKWKEPMMDDRIYFININPEEKNKPISSYEILDKCKFITHENGKYLISYRKYSGMDLIDFYNKGVKENKDKGLPYNDSKHNKAQAYINYCLGQKKGSRLYFNTFTKYILERIFENHGYDNVIHYRNKNELKRWSSSITQQVKNFVKAQDTKYTDWSKKEQILLVENINKPEKELSRMLNRTVPSIATMKWKIRHGEVPGIKVPNENNVQQEPKIAQMKSRTETISQYLKKFRKEKGLRQKEFAKESGISVSVISQLECGKYIGTDTPIVEDLLKYVDENSKVLNLSDIPSSDEPMESPKEEETKSPSDSQAPITSPNLSEINVDNVKVEYLEELLSEIKFMNGQLLKMQGKINILVPGVSNGNNNGKRKGTIRLANKLKELQS